MATTMSCIIVTTLIVVSLANLILLVHVIMQSTKKCEPQHSISVSKNRLKKIQKTRKSQDISQDYRASINNYKFMAAIILVGNEEEEEEENEMEFICGAAIISKFWAITPAHCAQSIAHQDVEKVKISINSSKINHPQLNDCEKIVTHNKFDSVKRTNNLALIKSKQPFKGKNVVAISLPTSNFIFLANASAVILGWGMGEQQDQPPQLYAMEVKLFSLQTCQDFYPEEKVIEYGLFCAGRYATEGRTMCIVDYGGVLVTKDLLIGVISYGIGCTRDGYPSVYTNVAQFENWIRLVDKSKTPIGAVFKG